MKFAMKSIVAAASFVAVAAAQAAVVTVPTDGSLNSAGVKVTATGSLEFSQLLASALTVGKATVGAYGAGTATPVTRPIPGSTTGKTYKSYIIGAGINTLSYDTATGYVTNVATTGGAVTALVDGPTNDSILATGGTANIGELSINLNGADNSATINGTITGAALDGTQVNWSGVLFTVAAGGVTGATKFTTTPGTYNTTLTGLAITDAGFAQLVNAFGLDSTGLGYSSLQKAAGNFGTMNSAITVTAVPEPSTYALMGLGLVGMSLVARRRAK